MAQTAQIIHQNRSDRSLYPGVWPPEDLSALHEYIMRYFSPKQVARALGISIATLKRWCDDGKIQAMRTPGGHRRISKSAILDFLNGSGQRLVQPEILGLPDQVRGRDTPPDQLRFEIYRALIDGKEAVFRGLIMNLFLSGMPLHHMFDSMLAPAFHMLGKDWEHNRLSIYQEHLATEMCSKILFELQERLPSPSSHAPYAIGGTLGGDTFMLPNHMVSLALRQAGWNADSLGTNLPAETLEAAILRHKPRIFWLSISSSQNSVAHRLGLRKLRKACQSTGSILALGGRALSAVADQPMENALICSDIGSLIDNLDGFAKGVVASD